MSHQEDEDPQIKDEAKVIPDIDHDVPDFSVDASVNRAEIVAELEVKPETEMLPAYTEGRIAFSLFSVHIYIYRFNYCNSV